MKQGKIIFLSIYHLSEPSWDGGRVLHAYSTLTHTKLSHCPVPAPWLRHNSVFEWPDHGRYPWPWKGVWNSRRFKVTSNTNQSRSRMLRLGHICTLQNLSGSSICHSVGTTRDSGKSKLILQPWSFVLVAAQTFAVSFCVKTNSVCANQTLFVCVVKSPAPGL